MLHPRQRFLYGAEIYVVQMVNESRAYCVPEALRTVEIKPLVGQPVKFAVHRSGISISPHSEVELLPARPNARDKGISDKAIPDSPVPNSPVTRQTELAL